MRRSNLHRAHPSRGIAPRVVWVNPVYESITAIGRGVIRYRPGCIVTASHYLI